MQLLLHGGTYNSSYWDWLVGHSLGSAVSVIEASTYHDVQGVVLTGLTHHLSVSALVAVFTQDAYPAILEPKFAGTGIDPEYLTTIPGKLGPFFYASGDADPSVIASDEATKDAFSTTEVADDVALEFVSSLSLQIEVPVLVADGRSDAIFWPALLASGCSSAASLRQEEGPYFSKAACLQTFVPAGAGHDLNLAANTGDFRTAALEWADTFVGSVTGPASPPPGSCP